MTTAMESAETALTPLHDGSRDGSRDGSHDGSHDFDFLHGRWKVHHRRLRSPLSGSNEWYEFDGTAVERALWDCRANVEELDAKLPDGRLRGLALRLYSPSSRQWAIHWSTAENGMLDQPMMIGDFRNGCGKFYNQAASEARGISVRLVLTGITRTSWRWEQAYSTDRGTTWETNWTMEFTRTASRR
jgi:hypothetical protein